MEKYAVLKTSALKDGQMKGVKINNVEFLVAKVNEKFLITEGKCPHLGGKLANGILNDTVVTCPLHGSQFDLTNGRVIHWTNWSGLFSRLNKILRSPRPLKIFDTEVEGDTVYVKL